jgi:flagellar hook-length control protein FliK
MTIRTGETASAFTTREPIVTVPRECCDLFDAVLRAPPRSAQPTEAVPAESKQFSERSAGDATVPPSTAEQRPPEAEQNVRPTEPTADPENAATAAPVDETATVAAAHASSDEPSDQQSESDTPSAEETALAAAAGITAPPTPLPEAPLSPEEPAAENQSNAPTFIADALQTGVAETPLASATDDAVVAPAQAVAGSTANSASTAVAASPESLTATELTPQIAESNSEQSEPTPTTILAEQPVPSAVQVVASESATPTETITAAADDEQAASNKLSSDKNTPAKPARAEAPLAAAPLALPDGRPSDQQADAHNQEQATSNGAERSSRRRDRASSDLSRVEPTASVGEILRNPSPGAPTTESAVPAPTLDITAAQPATGTNRVAGVDSAATTAAPNGAIAAAPAISQPSHNYPKAAAQLLTGLRRTSETRQQDVDQVRLMQRVARALESARDRGGEVRIRLNPPELGLLKVELQVQDGRLHARLEAETPAAQVVLLENVGSLRERLAEQGLRLERFDVDLSHRDSSGAGGQSGQPRDEAPRELFRPRPTLPAQTRAAAAATEIPAGSRPGDDRQVNVVV